MNAGSELVSRVQCPSYPVPKKVDVFYLRWFFFQSKEDNTNMEEQAKWKVEKICLVQSVWVAFVVTVCILFLTYSSLLFLNGLALSINDAFSFHRTSVCFFAFISISFYHKTEMRKKQRIEMEEYKKRIERKNQQLNGRAAWNHFFFQSQSLPPVNIRHRYFCVSSLMVWVIYLPLCVRRAHETCYYYVFILPVRLACWP